MDRTDAGSDDEECQKANVGLVWQASDSGTAFGCGSGPFGGSLFPRTMMSASRAKRTGVSRGEERMEGLIPLSVCKVQQQRQATSRSLESSRQALVGAKWAESKGSGGRRIKRAAAGDRRG